MSGAKRPKTPSSSHRPARVGPVAEPATDPAGLAEYVADITAELARLTGAAKLEMLTYFLNLARIEAEAIAQRGE
jgi:hypothetical protein